MALTADNSDRSSAGDWRLVLLLAASIVLPLSFLAALAFVTYRNEMDQANAIVSETVDLMHEHAARVFDTTELVARSIEPIIAGLDAEEIRSTAAGLNLYLEQLIQEYEQFYSVAIISADGEPLVSARTFPIPPDADLSEREYFTILRDNPELDEYISRVLRSVVDDTTTFFQVARPRRQTGEFEGLVTVSLQPDYFKDVYARFAGERPLVAGLVRADGTILAIHPYADVALDETAPVEGFADAIARADTDGGVPIVDDSFGGDALLIAFEQVGDRPVYAAVALPMQDVRGDWLRSVGFVAAGLLPLTLALFWITLQTLRRTRDREAALRQLREETARRETAEDALRQAQKMEAIGQLSGGIAHDFNNLMTAVGGNLELLGRKLATAAPDLLRYVDSGREGVRRASALTQRLLAFARRQPLNPEPTNINALLNGMSELLHRSLGERVEIEIALGAGLWLANVDGNQLENAILNLSINARDAMPEGGKLTIETTNAHLDRDYVARERLDDLVPGQFVLLSVSDTGTGMPAETIARAFDPFFTTKAPGEGTGLGLSMVHGFVKQSGGHLKIYSEIGHGTTIKLYLPRYANGGVSAPDRIEDSARPKDWVHAGTILLVEDDADVLAFEMEALSQEGFSLLQAHSAAEAIAMLESDRIIDLIITDVILAGGPSGREVADKAAQLRPGTPVLFTTGYSANAIVHQGRLDPGVELLTKPFSTQELVARASQLLKPRS